MARSRSRISGSSTTSRDAGSGLFLVLEGPEGAGKTTHAESLRSWLTAQGQTVTGVREPGGTPVGEAIRRNLWVPSNLDLTAESELFLVLAARAELIRHVVRPALERGEVVLADRHDLSTLAYQGYGRGLPLEDIRRANSMATGGIRPDLYVLLDVSVDVGTSRQLESGKDPDRMERAGNEFMERVRNGYLEMAATDESVERVDAARGLKQVQKEIRAVLYRRFPERLAPDGAPRRGT